MKEIGFPPLSHFTKDSVKHVKNCLNRCGDDGDLLIFHRLEDGGWDVSTRPKIYKKTT